MAVISIKKLVKKLYKQANIILKSLLNDFNKISNLKIVYTRDQRFKKIKVKNAKCFFIKKKPHILFYFYFEVF